MHVNVFSSTWWRRRRFFWNGNSFAMSSTGLQMNKSLKSADRLKQNQRKPQPHKKRRPANPPARLAFRQRKRGKRQRGTKTNQKRGQIPNKNTHRIDQLSDAAASTASQAKTCKTKKRIEYRSCSGIHEDSN